MSNFKGFDCNLCTSLKAYRSTFHLSIYQYNILNAFTQPVSHRVQFYFLALKIMTVSMDAIPPSELQMEERLGRIDASPRFLYSEIVSKQREKQINEAIRSITQLDIQTMVPHSPDTSHRLVQIDCPDWSKGEILAKFDKFC